MLIFTSRATVARFVSTRCGLRRANIGLVQDKFVRPLHRSGRINPVVSVFPFGAEGRLRFLESLGRIVTAGPVGDIYVNRSKDQPGLMGSQAKIQIIEMESELLIEAYMPNFFDIDGQK